MLRRRKWSVMTMQHEPLFSGAETPIISHEPGALPNPPLPIKKATSAPLPPMLQLLTLLGLILGVVVCGVGLLLIQDVAPDIAALLFTLMLAVAVLLFLFYYRQQIVTALLAPFRILIRFYTMDTVAAHPQPQQQSADVVSLAVSLVLIGTLLLVVLLLPVSPLLGIILFLAVAAIIYFTRRSSIDPLIAFRRYVAYLKVAPDPRTITLPVVATWTVIAEWIVIVIIIILVTRVYQSPDPHVQFSGREAEWITSSAYAATAGMRQYGRIPLWQPYLEQGEPLVENPVGFIFNPFAMLPSLLWGPQLGLRLSVVLHVLLAGLGGWFLARILGLGGLGRVLLALLLVGKGGMHAMLGAGYFQLALSQVFMPWVIGGVIAIVRLPHSAGR